MLFNANVDILGRLTARNFSFQEDVSDIQQDNTLDPGASPTNGTRYIISNSGSLHANFGTINKLIGGTAATLGNGDIVEYVSASSEFRIAFDASVYGEGAKSWDRDSNAFYSYNGSAWVTDSSSIPYFDDLQDVSLGGAAAGDIVMYNGTNWADADIGNGLQFVSTPGSESISAKLDGSTLTSSGSGLKVSTSGITANELASDSVTNAKMADDSVNTAELVALAVTEAKLASNSVTTVKILDANVTLAKLASNSVDASKIVDGSVGASELASDSVTTIKILDSNVTTAKLANDSVNTDKLDYASTALRSKISTWSSGTSFSVVHNWNTRYIMVEVYDSNYNTIYLDSVQRDSVNQVTLTATEAPSADYTVMIRECANKE
jgi:hypothetical protein